ncbi:MAG TPA: hypothetical protein VHO47_02855 [Candidatus Babeliales bacterium]|nr:hypothetical protein [Candidatus Babeliales bacterium]
MNHSVSAQKKISNVIMATFLIITAPAQCTEWYENPIFAGLAGLSIGGSVASGLWWYNSSTPPNVDSLLLKADALQEKIDPIIISFKDEQETENYLFSNRNAADRLTEKISEFFTESDALLKESMRPDLLKDLNPEKKELLNKMRSEINKNRSAAKQLSILVESRWPFLKINNYLANNYIELPIAKPDASNPYPHMRKISMLNNEVADLIETLNKSKELLSDKKNTRFEMLQKNAEIRITKLNAELGKLSEKPEYKQELTRRETERHHRELEVKKERKVKAKEQEAAALLIDATARQTQAELASYAYQKKLIDAENTAKIAQSKIDLAESKVKSAESKTITAQENEKQAQNNYEAEKSLVQKIRACIIGFVKAQDANLKKAQDAYDSLEREFITPSVNPELVEERIAKLKEHAQKIKDAFVPVCPGCIKDLENGTFDHPCNHGAGK